MLRKRMLVLLLIVLKEAGPTAAQTCPGGSCSSTVCRCWGGGFTSIPQDLPTTITTLYFWNNAITTLSQADLLRDHDSSLNPNDLDSRATNIHPETRGNLQSFRLLEEVCRQTVLEKGNLPRQVLQ
ncbi:Hypp869 [Branchiostoma lanceolatum]|uniref:Hypp869 protein n=1 Tax=Branchiostoma lanceolatum TaxID=7740 RepID=A0A8J9YPW0_BRALA|nr:Hypp869 [Branchiostoma lanceolatum]